MIVQTTGQFNQYRTFLDNLAECLCVDRWKAQGKLTQISLFGLPAILAGAAWLYSAHARDGDALNSNILSQHGV